MATVEHLLGIREVDHAILQGNDAVLKIILEKCRDHTHADAAQLFRVHGSHLALDLTVPHDSNLASTRVRLLRSESACGTALTSHEFLLISDVRLHRGLYPNLVEFHSELIAPLWHADEPIGAISLTSKVPRHFTVEHGTFAKTLAEQAMVAIVHADVLQELAELRKIDAAILRNDTTPDDLAVVVLESILKLTNAQHGQIFELDPARRLLKVRATTGHGSTREVSLESSVCGAAVRANRSIRIANWKEDEVYRELFRECFPGSVSELVVPVPVSDMTLVLNVESSAEAAFTLRHQHILEDFGPQAVIGIRSFARTQEHISDLHNLTKVAAELALTSHLERAIYDKALTAANLFAECPYGQILIPSSRDGFLKVIASTGKDRDAEVPVSESGSGLAIESDTGIVLSNDLETAPLSRFRQWLPVRTESVLMVVIRLDGKCTGVINLESGHKNHFSERHVNLIKQLAECVSTALRIKDSYQGLSRVGHDVGTWGGSIANFAKKIVSDPTASNVKAIAERIEKLGVALCALREDILPHEPHPGLLFLPEVVSEIVPLIAIEASVKLDVSGVTTAAVPPVSFDVTHLKRVLSHLLENSKHAVSNTKNPRISVSLHASPDGSTVQVRVLDNGVGMSKAQQDQAFRPGYSTKKGKGSGFGLSFCEQILMAGHGKIEIISSEPGRGTTIAVTIPAAAALFLSNSQVHDREVLLVSNDDDWAREVIDELVKQGICANQRPFSDFSDEEETLGQLRTARVIFIDLRGTVEYSNSVAKTILNLFTTHRRRKSQNAPPAISMGSPLFEFPVTASFACDLVRQAIEQAKAE
jgi:GAF domain-containing protein/anti-sigma regulatory factor (Ser/Thr protein kinase)